MNLNGCILGLSEPVSKGLLSFVFGNLLLINLWVILVRNTSRKLLKIILNTIFIFLVILVSSSSVIMCFGKTYKEIITDKRLVEIKNLVVPYIDGDGSSIKKLEIKGNDINYGFTNWVFSFLSKEDMEKYHNSSLFYDAWFTPFNVDYVTNLTGLSESLSNSLSKYSVVVWSSGPNRKDERCLGDDIVWPLLDEEGVSRRFLLEQEWGAKVKH